MLTQTRGVWISTVHPGQVLAQTFKEADFVHLMSYDSCAAGSYSRVFP